MQLSDTTKDRRNHVLITGATGGIGRELVRQCAQDGFAVSALGRNRVALDQLATLGEAVRVLEGDVTRHADVQSAVAAAEDAHGPITHCIAASAIYPKGHILDQPPEQLGEVLQANVVGVAHTVRAVLPAMLAANFGRIVVFGSLADMNPLPGSLSYSVSKGALHSLVRGIANEIDRDRYPNVLINEFSPGATRSGMSDWGHDPAEIYPMVKPLLQSTSGGPTGRFFQEGSEVHIGESWKRAIKRLILRR